MQPRRGSSDGAGIFCKNCLVAIAICEFVLAFNVRRQGNVSESLELTGDRFSAPAREPNCSQTEFTSRENFRFQLPAPKKDPFTHWQFTAGTNQRFPRVAGDAPRQENFDGAAEVLPFT